MPSISAVRILLHQHAVDERAGVALVAVCDHVSRTDGRGRRRAPLLTGREARATPPAEPRALHRRENRLRTARERAVEGRVGAVPPGPGQVREPPAPEAAGDDRLEAMGAHARGGGLRDGRAERRVRVGAGQRDPAVAPQHGRGTVAVAEAVRAPGAHPARERLRQLPAAGERAGCPDADAHVRRPLRQIGVRGDRCAEPRDRHPGAGGELGELGGAEWPAEALHHLARRLQGVGVRAAQQRQAPERLTGHGAGLGSMGDAVCLTTERTSAAGTRPGSALGWPGETGRTPIAEAASPKGAHGERAAPPSPGGTRTPIETPGNRAPLRRPAVLSGVGQDHVRRALGDHHDRRVDVA